MRYAVESGNVTYVDDLFDAHLETSQKLRQSNYRERRLKLRALHDAIIRYQDRIEAALKADLNKCTEEARITEIIPTLAELQFAYRKLPGWMRDKRVRNTFPILSGKSYLRYEPKGRVLIISPWNYPYHLAITPLISAIAAGNCAIIKPSEFSPNTGHTLHELIASVFDENEVAVIQGGVDTARYLLRKPFDHIFFTGSPDKGKLVMAAAAENLTSVTLELGGKSPVIIDESADIEDAARKVAWGKFLNAGQTCIAPDYILVPEHLTSAFVQAVKDAFRRFLGGDSKAEALGRIISGAHYHRLLWLLEEAADRGAHVEMIGENREVERYMAPIVLTGVDRESAIMQEEIFGPLLPVIPVKNNDEAVTLINERPKPLALYIFGNDKSRIQNLLDNTTAGGTCVNDVIVHFINFRLPFGGVNQSGTGRYHGFHGFEELSNKRAIYRQSRFGYVHLLYPPYTKFSRKLIGILVKYFSR